MGKYHCHSCNTYSIFVEDDCTSEGAPKYWTGISRKSACTSLQGPFNKQYTPRTGARDEPSKFCAVFMPARNDTSNPSQLGAHKCDVSLGTGRDASFCGSYHHSLPETGNIWGSTAGLPSLAKVRWTKEMQTDPEQARAKCL